MLSALLVLLIAQSSFEGANPGVRPDPDGVPTKVAAAIYVIDVSAIDDVEQSFTADVFMSLEWKDVRLIAKEPTGQRRCALHEVWNPNIQVLNQKSISRKLPQVVTVTDDGTVTYRQRFIGKFTIPLHLADFPFDAHRLDISIVSAGNTPDDVEFTPDPDFNGRAAKLTLAGWMIDDGRPLVRPYRVEIADRDVARFKLEFNVRRSSLFYILRLIGPLFLIVLIGWGTCWIDPSNPGAQIRLGATGFLTLVAYQFAVGRLLPKVSYLTRMDLFVAGTTLIIFLALGKAVVADSLVAKDKLATAVRINSLFRWFYFFSVIIVAIVAFAL